MTPFSSSHTFSLNTTNQQKLIRDICERSQWSGKRSANSSGGEAHGYRSSPSQQAPKLVTASAKALMLLLFFPQHLHVIYAICTATTPLRLTAREKDVEAGPPQGFDLLASSGAHGPTNYPEASST